MEANGEKFVITYKGQDVTVQPAIHKGRGLYEINMQNKRLFITQVTASKGAGTFWTSLPQGDQELAEELGELIEQRTRIEQQKLF